MKARPTLLLTITVSLLLLQPTFAALPRYEITDLGLGTAGGINDAGQVTGVFWSQSGQRHAFLWNKTTGMMDLGTLGGPWSYAIGINNVGQVTGESRTADGENHAFLWDKTGGMIDLGTLPGYAHSRPHGINNAGQVVGDSGDTAFLWEDGKMIELGTLGSSSYARAINNIGNVVGYSYLIPIGFHAFLWDSKNGMRDLGTLAHSSWSEAFGINDCGQIVGISGDHVFLWEDGEMTDLGTLWQFSVFCTINDATQIVGTVEHYEGEYYAFYWDTELGMIRLDELLPADSGWRTLWRANDINNRAQIVGLGITEEGEYHAYLMTPIPPKIIYVDDDAAGAKDGSSWEDAFNYLQDALTAAWSGDEIHVAQGIYTPDSNSADPNGSGDRTATFHLINGVTLKGGYAGVGAPDPNDRDIEFYETILSGDIAGNDRYVKNPYELLDDPCRAENSYHVVTANGTDDTSILDGFTITAGNANGSWTNSTCRGGGMYNYTSTPVVTNCIFRANWAGEGGGMDNSGSSPAIFNCAFIGNCAGQGGGMYNIFNSPTLNKCIFSENYAEAGGGMFNCGEAGPVLVDCTFIWNSAVHGAGIYDNYNGTLPSMINCTFTENSASDEGGGMKNVSSSPALVNCMFNGNSAGRKGGGMYNGEGDEGPSEPRLTNCTITDNLTTGKGGGMYNGSKSTVTNCIFWGNMDNGGMDESAQIYVGFLMEINYSCIQGWTSDLGGTGNIGDNPFFVDPNNGDYHLQSDSPCIDAGDPDYVSGPNETDLDGNPRIIGRRIDMGAYEYRRSMKIVPHTINLASKGKWITSYVWLPEEYDVADIDPNSILLEGEIEADTVEVDVKRQVVIAKFSREDIQLILDVGDIKLTITCQLTDGTVFEAKDNIKVVDKAGLK